MAHDEDGMDERERELQERIDRLTREERIQFELPEVPALSNVDDKVDALHAKVENATKGHLPDVPDWDYKRPKIEALKKPEAGNAEDGLGKGFAIGYTVIGAPLAGLVIGLGIDKLTGAHYGVPFGVIIGAAVGVFLAAKMSSDSK